MIGLGCDTGLVDSAGANVGCATATRVGTFVAVGACVAVTVGEGDAVGVGDGTIVAVEANVGEATTRGAAADCVTLDVESATAVAVSTGALPKPFSGVRVISVAFVVGIELGFGALVGRAACAAALVGSSALVGIGAEVGRGAAGADVGLIAAGAGGNGALVGAAAFVAEACSWSGARNATPVGAGADTVPNCVNTSVAINANNNKVAATVANRKATKPNDDSRLTGTGNVNERDNFGAGTCLISDKVHRNDSRLVRQPAHSRK